MAGRSHTGYSLAPEVSLTIVTRYQALDSLASNVRHMPRWPCSALRLVAGAQLVAMTLDHPHVGRRPCNFRSLRFLRPIPTPGEQLAQTDRTRNRVIGRRFGCCGTKR